MQKLKEKLLLTAMFYRQTLSEEQLVFYTNAFRDQDEEKVIAALEVWVNGTGHENNFMPRPGSIIAMIAPPEDRETPEEIASKILKAVKNYGYNNPYAAMSYLGPIGWEVASSIRGSWTSLCETLMERDTNTFLAQARELARVKLERKQEQERHEKIQELSSEISAKLGQGLRMIEG